MSNQTEFLTQGLEAYAPENRYWQGIPGIEVTKGGRIFVSLYSGGYLEGAGNFALLLVSDDGGKTFRETAVARIDGEARCYDPTLWIDPLGRLWFIWSVQPENRVEFARCDDPDAETLTWGPVTKLGFEVMLNKPTVCENGDWLFPCAVWKKGLLACGWGSDGHPIGSHVFLSTDQGETFTLHGTALTRDRWFDEHIVLQQKDGSLSMFIRTTHGIAVSTSTDGGKTWTPGVDAGLGGPNSRFFVRRLASGNVLLVNHVRFAGRNNLTALLSTDDGKTYPFELLLDERDNVSYPDVKEADDSFIYIVYDRERGALYNETTDYTNYAREILFAKITEADIKAGALVTEGSSLKNIASRLGSRTRP